MRTLLLAVLLLVLLPVSVASRPQPLEFPPDRVFQYILTNRPAYARVVFVFGDSVSMICSLKPIDFSGLTGKADDTKTKVSAMADLMRQSNDPGERAKDPLWRMHSLASALNAQFAASGLLTTPDNGLTVPEARLVAAYGGSLGMPLPRDVETRSHDISRLIDTGVIRDGDVVIMEDAGYNGRDPDAYEQNWLLLGRTVLQRVGVTLVLFDMFDDIPEQPVMGLPPDDFRFEVPFPSPATGGSRSHNQALRDAVAKLAVLPGCKGRLVFVDMRRRMDAFGKALRETLGVAPLSPEGIHPNVWGEAFLARELLRGAGLAPLLTNPRPYLDLLADNAGRLSPDASAVDPAKARTFIDAWLAP